jgi:hypothetical protein
MTEKTHWRRRLRRLRERVVMTLFWLLAGMTLWFLLWSLVTLMRNLI